MFGPMPLSPVDPARRAVTLLAAAAVHVLLMAGAARLTMAAPVPATAPDTTVIYVATDQPPASEAGGGGTTDRPGPPPFPVGLPDLPALPADASLAGVPSLPIVDARRFALGTGSGPSDWSSSSTATGAVPGTMEVDEPPALVRSGRADYPTALEAAGVGGTVRLRFVVDTTGLVRDGSVEILSATHPSFADAARRAVADSRFRPGRHRWRPVAVLVEQVVSFRAGDLE
jgi:TonB family protein